MQRYNTRTSFANIDAIHYTILFAKKTYITIDFSLMLSETSIEILVQMPAEQFIRRKWFAAKKK